MNKNIFITDTLILKKSNLIYYTHEEEPRIGLCQEAIDNLTKTNNSNSIVLQAAFKSPRKKGWRKINISFDFSTYHWHAKFRSINLYKYPIGYSILGRCIKTLTPLFESQIKNKTSFSIWIKITPVKL